jgi:hypothetical protein
MERFEQDEICWWRWPRTRVWWPVRVIDICGDNYCCEALDEEAIEDGGGAEATRSLAGANELKKWLAIKKPRTKLVSTGNVKFSADEIASYALALRRAQELLKEAQADFEKETTCAACQQQHENDDTIICGGCARAFHCECAMLDGVPDEDEWYCVACAGACERVVRAAVSAAIAGVLHTTREVAADNGSSGNDAAAEVEVYNDHKHFPARILERRMRKPNIGTWLKCVASSRSLDFWVPSRCLL